MPLNKETKPNQIKSHRITEPKEERVNFIKKKLQFVAHLFISEGIKPDPRKIEAVISCKEAKSKEEVRSFLRMTGYLDNFIRNFATLSAALLKNLTTNKKNSNGRAKKKFKLAITNPETMDYFYLKSKLR